jgi:phage gpG-like protein
VIFFVEALGIRQVQTKFTRMSEAAIDASPVMETLADTMMAIIATIFESQGRRGGGSIGSALEYAEVSNENRPFTKFTQRDKAVMRAEVRSYLMAAWRHGLRPK